MESGYIYIHNNVFPTLLAISSDEQSQGLMHQPWPPPIMSFVYATPTINKFWMKATPSPLDIIFCHAGKVSEICYGEPHSTAVIGGDHPSDLVIELPFGTASSSDIKIGQSAGLVKPTLDELRKIIASKSHSIIRF